MWAAIDASKDRLATYLDRKRRMLGLKQLGWQDVDAPVGETSAKLTYDEAANFIVTHFGKVSPRMAQLAGKAFEDRWIESEDRPGKRMGGFCTNFPDKSQSRIFVTFSGTLSNTATVAHELGHAYHQHVMNDLAPFNQQYAMNVAETASTFAEMVVADAALNSARSPEEKLVLLEDKLHRAVTLLMNIQCRFLFETRFYEERAKGIVSVERLNALMEGAQKDAFAGVLGRYHPHFWASKLHLVGPVDALPTVAVAQVSLPPEDRVRKGLRQPAILGGYPGHQGSLDLKADPRTVPMISARMCWTASIPSRSRIAPSMSAAA